MAILLICIIKEEFYNSTDIRKQGFYGFTLSCSPPSSPQKVLLNAYNIDIKNPFTNQLREYQGLYILSSICIDSL